MKQLPKMFVQVLLMIPATNLFAYVPPEKSNANKRLSSIEELEPVLRPTHRKSFEKNLGYPGFSRIERDSHSGEIRLLAGRSPDFKVSPGSSLAVHDSLSRKFVARYPEIFELKKKHLRLDQQSSLVSDTEAFIKYRLVIRGLEVLDSSVDFRFKNGALVQVSNQSFAEAEIDLTKDDSQLSMEASKLVPGARVLNSRDAYRVVKHDAGGYQLRRVRVYDLEKEGEQFHAELQSVDASIFAFYSQHLHYGLKATARVPERYPDGALQDVVLDNLQFKTGWFMWIFTDSFGLISDLGGRTPELQGLLGRYVKVYSKSGYRIGNEGELSDGQWSYHLQSPLDDKSWMDTYNSQLMVYRYTSEIIEYAKKFISSPWLERPLKANVNLRKECNAHWNGWTVNFYSGSEKCSNSGLLADVISHEWGHGLHANTGGIRDRAFSEGFGDIMAMLMSLNPKMGEGFFRHKPDAMRDLSIPRKYPDDKGEIHFEGQIIASTFWDLFRGLEKQYGSEKARDTLANYAFKMIYTATKYTDVYDVLQVIDNDSGDLNQHSKNHCLLNQVFSDHGLATKEESCHKA